MLNVEQVFSCIELSAGEGALIDPITKINNSLQFTTVDLDPANSHKLAKKYPNDIHICDDALNLDLDIKDNSFDLAVCNPPFAYTAKTNEHEKILGKEFSAIFSGSKRIRLEVLFILRNLALLKNNSTLAIIVPDLIFSSDKLVNFRKLLFREFSLSRIVECEHRNFKKTEAKTFILFINKSKPKNDNTKIPYTTISGGDSTNSYFNLDNAFEVNSVSEIDSFEIFRGATSSKLCRSTKEPFHHNYANVDDFSIIHYPYSTQKLDNFKYASEGDILIHRVGRNVGKTVILGRNSVIVSDCIIVIRFSNLGLRNKFIDIWKEQQGFWLTANAKGTCAKSISIRGISSYIASLNIS